MSETSYNLGLIEPGEGVPSDKPAGPGKISWNFEKFMVGRDGQVVARFSPWTKPDAPELPKVLETELGKGNELERATLTGMMNGEYWGGAC